MDVTAKIIENAAHRKSSIQWCCWKHLGPSGGTCGRNVIAAQRQHAKMLSQPGSDCMYYWCEFVRRSAFGHHRVVGVDFTMALLANAQLAPASSPPVTIGAYYTRHKTRPGAEDYVEDYVVDHSTYIYLMNSGGNSSGASTPTRQTPASPMSCATSWRDRAMEKAMRNLPNKATSQPC